MTKYQCVEIQTLNIIKELIKRHSGNTLWWYQTINSSSKLARLGRDKWLNIPIEELADIIEMEVTESGKINELKICSWLMEG